MADALNILAALALVALNAFFVATEFAVTRIRPSQVTELQAQGRRGASSVRHAVDHLDAYLAACQLGITIASIGLGVLAEPAFEHLLEPVAAPLGDWIGGAAIGLSFVLAFALITLLHVVLGELTPKSLALARTVKVALVVAPPMRVFYRVAKPLVDLFNWMGNVVLKPFHVPPARESGHAPHSEDELRLLLAQSLKEGLIDPEEREFAENVFLFGDLRARQVMVPRGEIDYLVTGETVDETTRRVIESGHTRLPLCDPETRLDGALGVVNTKELLRLALEGSEVDLREISRPVLRVSESMVVHEMLKAMRRERQHVALVVDEYGTVVGLVSLEDILEEIVGEFDEEFEEEADELISREDGVIIIGGATSVGDVEDELEIEIGNGTEATIGGHVVEMLGRVPEPDESFDLEGRRLEVTRVDQARILELRVNAPDSAQSAPDHEPAED
jgi:CBS domain containing-hemolysin-like protein